MKTCPYCAEEIKDAAIVCKHCGRELEPDRVAEVHQSKSSDVTEATPIAVATPKPVPTPPNPEQAEILIPKRSLSLFIGSVLIGLSCAALSAAPLILDVLEAIELAANDPSAIPLMRMLEKDLAGRFIASLFIFSIIGGLVIWGWRRNRAITLGILFVCLMALLFLGVVSVFTQAWVSNGPASLVSSSSTLAPAQKAPIGTPALSSRDSEIAAANAEVLESEKANFVQYDKLLTGWMEEMGGTLDRFSRGVIDARTAYDELIDLSDNKMKTTY